jgi:hypothetical protein
MVPTEHDCICMYYLRSFSFSLKIINIKEILAIKNFENKMICIEHKNSKKNMRITSGLTGSILKLL